MTGEVLYSDVDRAAPITQSAEKLNAWTSRMQVQPRIRSCGSVTIAT
jgi:hypothetical protein